MGSAEAVLDLAFHTARAQLPTAQLVYNDYMSWEPPHAAHCADVLRLLEGFRRRNVPGRRARASSRTSRCSRSTRRLASAPIASASGASSSMRSVAMGYKLLVTEFDVKDKALPADLASRDAKVADYARRYFDLMLDYRELGDILAWGMVDRFSWLQGFAPRDDGLEVRCCPYDSGYRPKPLRTAIAESFAAV
jgi:endo-1,4-beta-xylanase